MKKIIQIAVREFVSTVFTKAFLIGLLILPAMIVLFAILMPRLFNNQNFQVKGEVAIIDPTGNVAVELRKTFEARRDAVVRAAEAQKMLAQVPEQARQVAAAAVAMAPPPELQLTERPANGDVQQEKMWLTAEEGEVRHLALVVVHPNAVTAATGASTYGTYDLYVPRNLDDRADSEIQQSLREAIINARVRARSLDRESINAIVNVPRSRSVTVTKDEERQTVGAFNVLLPISFIMLLFMGVMGGGQALLTSTVEEKSSRVVEVLLSAVSPMQLMTGKIIGHMAVSLLAMSIYIVLGIGALASFSLFGLLNPWLIVYLGIFFLITYLVIGSLMMAIGAAVNDMREAQSMMLPIILVLSAVWVLWFPVSRDPNSTFSIAVSFIPPINTFAMLLRLSSLTPPPWWQVWLSIGVGALSVLASIWFAAKVFRIGLLMYGKPPNFATLIRWVRAA